MRDERRVTASPIVGIAAVITLALIGLFAVSDAEIDPNTFGPSQIASHEYEDGGCWDGECYGGGQDYDQWNNEDRNRNRGRNRGAFSPGPFEDSPIDFRDNCISLDCGGRDRPPEEGRRP